MNILEQPQPRFYLLKARASSVVTKSVCLNIPARTFLLASADVVTDQAGMPLQNGVLMAVRQGMFDHGVYTRTRAGRPVWIMKSGMMREGCDFCPVRPCCACCYRQVAGGIA